MSEFNIEDLDAVIAGADSSLVQMLALQLKKQIGISKASDQQLAVVVAENGQMLSLLTDISENHNDYVNAGECLYAGVPMDYVSEINAYVSRDVDAENPFKETDAYLAEVRASEAKHVYDSILDNPAVTDMESLVDWLEQYSNDSASFAAQLRQGAAL